MYKKLALLFLSAVISCSNVTANNEQVDNTQESAYKEFADDYSKLFDEAPGKEWDVRQFNCNGGTQCGNKCNGGVKCGTKAHPQD